MVDEITRPLILVFSRVCRNLIYEDAPSGTKSDPIECRYGGGGTTTAPILARLLKSHRVAQPCTTSSESRTRAIPRCRPVGRSSKEGQSTPHHMG